MKFYIFVGVIFTATVFLLGLFTGNYVAKKNFSYISYFMRNAELNSESFILEQDFFEGFDSDCGLVKKRLVSLSLELYELGKIIDTATAERDLGWENYVFLKKKFHVMKIRNYLLNYKVKNKCHTAVKSVLFFFGKNDPLSKEQGRVLDEIVKNFDATVFAVESNFTKELAFLEEYYRVNQTPFLIVDYDQSFAGFTDYDKLAERLE